jgi:hypothetical protein
MRLIVLVPIALLAACQVSEGNNSVTVSYNEDVAENAAADIANGVEEAAEAVTNGAQEAGATIRNTDIDVDVDTKAGEDTKPVEGNRQ